ncbi:M12 family metallopeptidase [Mesorhizobium sp. M0292]
MRARIVLHMNAWAKSANVSFVETRKQAQVRIARIAGGDQGGYWSYLGTDILHIEKDQPTMNLEAFTMATSESEFKRVVRHETGHTLGFPHEHMRRQLVELIDRERAVQYFGETQGWSEDEVEQQVLTPIEDGSLLGTPRSDSNSIMCYEIPGEITKSGDPIAGGTDIDELDYEFAGSLYPK